MSDQDLDKDLDDDVLTLKQQMFVLEYIIDFNASRAARCAGYSIRSAREIGYNLVNTPKVKRAIEKAVADRSASLQVDAASVVAKYKSLVEADPTELSGTKIVNCRYCFGDNNEYQWTVAEYENAAAKAVNNGEPEPVCAGGVGFNVNGEPNEFCPECQGNGVEVAYINNTSRLTGGLSLLFDRVERTKFGLKIYTNDRMAALAMLAKHTGVSRETVNHISDDGSMTPAPAMDLSKLNDDELRALSKIVEKTEAE